MIGGAAQADVGVLVIAARKVYPYPSGSNPVCQYGHYYCLTEQQHSAMYYGTPPLLSHFTSSIIVRFHTCRESLRQVSTEAVRPASTHSWQRLWASRSSSWLSTRWTTPPQSQQRVSGHRSGTTRSRCVASTTLLSTDPEMNALLHEFADIFPNDPRAQLPPLQTGLKFLEQLVQAFTVIP